MSTTADAKLFMVVFEGVETLDSALSFCTGDEFFSVRSFFSHSITGGYNESM